MFTTLLNYMNIVIGKKVKKLNRVELRLFDGLRRFWPYVKYGPNKFGMTVTVDFESYCRIFKYFKLI